MVYISPYKVLIVFVSDTPSSIYSVQRDYESLEQKERYLSDKARDLTYKKEKINSQRDILDSQLRKLETEQKKLEIKSFRDEIEKPSFDGSKSNEALLRWEKEKAQLLSVQKKITSDINQLMSRKTDCLNEIANISEKINELSIEAIEVESQKSEMIKRTFQVKVTLNALEMATLDHLVSQQNSDRATVFRQLLTDISSRMIDRAKNVLIKKAVNELKEKGREVSEYNIRELTKIDTLDELWKDEKISPEVGLHFFEPTEFDEAAQIVDTLREKNITILDSKKVDDELAQRIVDFIAGASYGNSSSHRLGDNIFLFAPGEIPVIKPKNYDSIESSNKSKSSLKDSSSTKVVDEKNMDDPKVKKAIKSKN